MKLLKSAFSIVLLVGLLVGCVAPAAQETTETTTEMTVNTTAPNNEQLSELGIYLAPWKENVVEKAKQDGKLHYYFMSSEGKPMITTATYPEKWGDCCLIVMPDGSTFLIDTGHKPFAEILVKNLKQMGVSRIDYLLISHFHSDHFGGAVETGGLLDNFPVGQVFVTNAKDTTIDNFQLKCENLNIPVTTLMEGDDKQIGQMRLRVLWPTKTQETPEKGNSEQINNTSLVVRLDYKDHSALFTGDIYSGVEQTLASKYPALLDVDLLKAPHHGDNTSNSLSFATATSPKLVVVTGYAGLQNVTRMIYEGVGAQILDDKSWGYIHLTVSDKDMQWETSR